jgi:hypothetical protein
MEPDQDQEKPRPRFSPEDPLLQTVKEKLASSPDKKVEIRRLFSEPLTAKRSEIVAVRSGDVLTHLDYIIDSEIPVEYSQDPGESIMEKARGWYYLTPIYSNPFFEEHPELRGILRDETFLEEVYQNLSVYPDSIAFATALRRQVVPLLKPGWEPAMRNKVAEYDPHALDIDYSNTALFEDASRFLGQQIGRAQQAGLSPADTLSKARQERCDLIQQFADSLKEGGQEEEIVNFLFDVHKHRGGIIIGFNKNVIQGEALSDACPEKDTKGIIHGEPELVVKPKGGLIDLSKNPISAIETLGEYEDRILAEILN